MIIASAPLSTRDRRLRLLLLLAWAGLALWLAATHVFWRDEVRAFSIALQGESVAEMIRGLHGEGHPAIWYLLLRGLHGLYPHREALPAAAFLVAAGAMTLLVLRAPFRTAVIALVLFGMFGLYEYTVSARNYGIAMLMLFAIASAYSRWRDRGITIGLLLALLCNTAVPACFLAAGFLLFWLVELVSEEGLSWSPRYRLFLLNAAVAALGAGIAFATVFPTVHDAVLPGHAGGLGPIAVLQALATPAVAFRELAPQDMATSGLGMLCLGIALIGALLGLIRAPGALVASLFVLAAFSTFSQLVYPGSYRHQALFLVWLVVMYWLTIEGRGGRWPERWQAERRTAFVHALGTGLFVALLFAQLPDAFALAYENAAGIPQSQSRNLGRLLERERLQRAILVANPDVMLEPVPYYADNPIYLLREERFGKVARFTRTARFELSLDQLLDTATRLRAHYRRPVVIVLRHRLDPSRPVVFDYGYAGSLSTTPEQVARFEGATRKLATLSPAISDEIYDVYLLPLERPSPQT